MPNYSRVTYRGLYDGVDLDWYANRAGELEFDLTLAPGVDPGGIRLRYTGAGRLTVDPSGALVLDVGGHRLRQAPPVVYQEVGGTRKPLQGRYVLHGDHRVGFAVAGYDATAPLVIDPVITYSTYLGGSGDEFPIWSDIDRAGNFYVTGFTNFPDLPTTGGVFQPTFGGGDGDAFVAKLNRSGSGLVWSTYLGGDASDVGIGLDVDRHGNVVVTGETGSTGFPTTPGSFQPGFGGGPGDGFVVKLRPNGARLVYSTFIGGSGADGAHDGELDRKGNFYLTGFTGSTDFPTTRGAFQPTFGGGTNDAWAAKLSKTGTALVYSTYLGGQGDEDVFDLTTDRSGSAYVPGQTSSADFPVTRGGVPGRLRWRPRRRLPGPAQPQRVAAAVRELPGRQRRGRQRGGRLLAGRQGNWFIPGATDSADFPVTPGAYQTANAGGFDGFLVKVDLEKHKGSGQRTASVTAQAGGSGARTGLTRDRMSGWR